MLPAWSDVDVVVVVAGIVDPTGHLGLLRDEVSPRFHYPVAVQRRYEDVLSKIETRLLALDPTAAWHDQVTAWLSPTSLTTQVVLVAALRNPTVRLRYSAARTVLHCHDQDAFYLVLLGLLGCAGRDRHIVPVFWIIATYARGQKILAADAPARLRHHTELRFRAAVTDLLGIRDTAGLLARREAVRELLPALQESAASITRAA